MPLLYLDHHEIVHATEPGAHLTPQPGGAERQPLPEQVPVAVSDGAHGRGQTASRRGTHNVSRNHLESGG